MPYRVRSNIAIGAIYIAMVRSLMLIDPHMVVSKVTIGVGYVAYTVSLTLLWLGIRDITVRDVSCSLTPLHPII